MSENFRTDLRTNVLLMLVMVIFTSDYGVHSRILETRLGLLEGITKEASHQKYFDAYYGIPFAKPPIGNLRFEPPVKAKPWKGVLNATKLAAMCPQIDADSHVYDGEEDCLHLNVFTPTNIKAGMNLPVIFYIFGGQFRKEYPTRCGPEYFMSRDIVMVIPNYRLAALGFLSTGDTVIAGNMALKDQLMAMKWTKENIYDFGGDPRRVTLHGHSSGSTCVHLHTISPLSADYFDQAIMQSAFGTEPMMFWDGDVAKGISRAFAARLNCTSYSSSSLKECFLNRTARELVLAADNLSLAKCDDFFNGECVPTTVFVPVIEDENVEGAFLTENPLLAPYPSSGKPWLLGITKNEGALEAAGTMEFMENLALKLSLSTVSGSIWYAKPNDVNFAMRWLEVRFFGQEEIRNATEGTTLAISKIKSGPKGLSLVEAVRKYEGVKYVYRFDYRYIGGYSNGNKFLNGRFLGATHGDEMPILFKQNFTGVAEEDLAFGDEMITRWVNFAYSGNPNSPFPLDTNMFGAWDPVSSPRIEFLRIDRNGGMEKDYFEEEFGFWRRLPFFSKYSSN